MNQSRLLIHMTDTTGKHMMTMTEHLLIMSILLIKIMNIDHTHILATVHGTARTILIAHGIVHTTPQATGTVLGTILALGIAHTITLARGIVHGTIQVPGIAHITTQAHGIAHITTPLLGIVLTIIHLGTVLITTLPGTVPTITHLGTVLTTPTTVPTTLNKDTIRQPITIPHLNPNTILTILMEASI